MNAFDYIAVAWLALAARNGYRQGLAREFYRLLRLGIALFAGTSLYGLFSRGLARVSGLAVGWTDPAIFVGIAAGTWFLLRMLRKWIEAWMLLHTPAKWQSLGGALAAVAKTALWLGAVLATFHLATWLPGHALVAQESLAARLAAPFLPGPAGQ